jgi:DNA-binding SARP family transcriptional activator
MARDRLPRSTLTDAPSDGWPQPDAVELRLLPGFQLRSGGRFIPAAMAVQRILAFLALADGPLHRPHVAGALWPDVSQRRANANLRSAVWRVHGTGVDLVEVTADRIGLASQVAVDYRVAAALARSLLCQEWRDNLAVNETCLANDLLCDWDEEWVALERERFRQNRLHALERFCENLIAAGYLARAVEAAELAIAGEPLRETSRRLLIRAHLAEGNRAEALREYRSYRQLLQAELSLEPSSLMEDLVGSLIR